MPQSISEQPPKRETPPFPAGVSRLREDQGKFAFSDAQTSGSHRLDLHAGRLARVFDHPAGRLALDSVSAGRAFDRLALDFASADRASDRPAADYPFEFTPWISAPI